MRLSSKMSQIRWCVLLSIISQVRWWVIIQYVTRKVDIFFIKKERSLVRLCFVIHYVTTEIMFCHPLRHKWDYVLSSYTSQARWCLVIHYVASQMMLCHPLCHKWDNIFFIQKITSQMMPSLSSILSQVPYVSFSIKYTSTARVQYVGPILFSTRDQNTASVCSSTQPS
jgi:hypothetical protein